MNDFRCLQVETEVLYVPYCTEEYITTTEIIKLNHLKKLLVNCSKTDNFYTTMVSNLQAINVFTDIKNFKH